MIKALLADIEALRKSHNFQNVMDSAILASLPSETYLIENEKIASQIGRHMTQRLLLETGFTQEKLHGIRKSTYGKPILSDEVDFNVSHAGSWVVCVISTTTYLGVDIEHISPLPLYEYAENFSSSEWESVNASADPLSAFYTAWTQKESFIKAYGWGMHAPLREVTLHGTWAQREGTPHKGYFHELNIPGYKCHICSQNPGETLQVARLNI